MATKDQVLDLRAKHPDWTPNEIAAELDCNPAYVRATIRRAQGYKPPRRSHTKISDKERAERQIDLRDIDILCDVQEGHSLRSTAAHWRVPYSYVRNLVEARSAT